MTLENSDQKSSERITKEKMIRLSRNMAAHSVELALIVVKYNQFIERIKQKLYKIDDENDVSSKDKTI